MFRVSFLCLRDEVRRWSLRLFSIEQLETNRVLRSLSALQRRKAIRKMFSELNKNDLDVLASRAVLYQQRVESGNPHPLDHEAMREIKRKEKLQTRANLINYDISVTPIKNNENDVNINKKSNTEHSKESEGATNNELTSSSTSPGFSASQTQEANIISTVNEQSTETSNSADANKRKMHKKLTSDKSNDDVITPEMIKEKSPFEFFVKEQQSNPSMAAITSEEERMTKLKEIFDTLPDTAREVIAKNAHEHAIKMARRRLAAAKARCESKELTRSTTKGKKTRSAVTKGKKSKKEKKKKSKAKNKKAAISETGKNNNNVGTADSNESSTELQEHEQTLKKSTAANNDNNDDDKYNPESKTDANVKAKHENKIRKLSSYSLFVKEQMLSVKHLPNKERLVEISKRWKALSDAERLNWKPEHTADKVSEAETPEIAQSTAEVQNKEENINSSTSQQLIKQNTITECQNKEKLSTESKQDNINSENQHCSTDSENTNITTPDTIKDKEVNVVKSNTSTEQESTTLPSESSESSTTLGTTSPLGRTSPLSPPKTDIDKNSSTENP